MGGVVLNGEKSLRLQDQFSSLRLTLPSPPLTCTVPQTVPCRDKIHFTSVLWQ